MPGGGCRVRVGGRSGGLLLLLSVVECFLEGRGEFEFVVEFVDGVEGSETLACFFRHVTIL